MTRLQHLHRLLDQQLTKHDGWMPFDRFMSLALYAPGLGYYSAKPQPITPAGAGPAVGDFITAPEISPHFARALAQQLKQALRLTGVRTLWEFGPGRGSLAAQLLAELGDAIDAYILVELSAQLRSEQGHTIATKTPAWAHKAQWLSALPDSFEGVVVANELLDAMPVRLIAYDGQAWLERGVSRAADTATQHGPRYVFADRPSEHPLHPPSNASEFPAGTVTELHDTAAAWMHTVAQALARGAIFLIDYGFPEHEYYHVQRHQGTLMCHQAHRSDSNPLVDVGDKDITAHVNFTAVALAGQEAGVEVLGYTSQARFLLNCGLLEGLQSIEPRALSGIQMLINEHEMGELFKVLGFVKGPSFDALGFVEGDRCHTL